MAMGFMANQLSKSEINPFYRVTEIRRRFDRDREYFIQQTGSELDPLDHIIGLGYKELVQLKETLLPQKEVIDREPRDDLTRRVSLLFEIQMELIETCILFKEATTVDNINAFHVGSRMIHKLIDAMKSAVRI